MTKTITFFAPGIPKGQPRPKAFSRGGFASVYDPGTAENWKSCIATAIKPHLPETPYDSPCCVAIEFLMPRPKGHFKTGKQAGQRKDTAPVLFLGKPDCDNLAKAVLDALTNIGLWRDDSIVWNLVVTKKYADAFAGANISIEFEIQQ